MPDGFDLLIKGGILVRGNGLFAHDLAVQGEKIAAVEPRIPAISAKKVIEIPGMYLLPGVIDVHTHPLYE
ncbi:MAG: Amidohydrolase family, partial [Deltaproteobacteria bacterium]|nr:Amidohydrolase family [Deltaproteobacteria bacterium]